MDAEGTALVATVALPVRSLTAEAFAPFGEVISEGEIGATSLDLTRGTPRFYVMTLKPTSMRFNAITRHRHVTQCLAATGGESWLIGVGAPAELESPDARPDEGKLVAFEVPGNVGIMLHQGTWHAGPHFTDSDMSFFNLEHIDTNTVDHHTVTLAHTYTFGV